MQFTKRLTYIVTGAKYFGTYILLTTSHVVRFSILYFQSEIQTFSSVGLFLVSSYPATDKIHSSCHTIGLFIE